MGKESSPPDPKWRVQFSNLLAWLREHRELRAFLYGAIIGIVIGLML